MFRGIYWDPCNRQLGEQRPLPRLSQSSVSHTGLWAELPLCDVRRKTHPQNVARRLCKSIRKLGHVPSGDGEKPSLAKPLGSGADCGLRLLRPEGAAGPPLSLLSENLDSQQTLLDPPAGTAPQSLLCQETLRGSHACRSFWDHPHSWQEPPRLILVSFHASMADSGGLSLHPPTSPRHPSKPQGSGSGG